MAPPTMKAFVTGKRNWLSIIKNGVARKDFGHGTLVSDSVPTPKLEPDEILIRVRTVAQNPTDWKHVDYLSPPHAIIGCDYVGEVAEIGPAVPAGSWKVGERVGGVAHGGLYRDQGAYAQFVRSPHDLAWKIPTSVSDRDATTYGVSAVTAMQALYHNLSIPWPGSPDATTSKGTILIYAGSTCAGLYALQMAKHAGWTTVTTCSPSNFDLVKSYGADAAYDYSSSTLVRDIRSAHPDITRALDCFSEGASTSICAQVLTPTTTTPGVKADANAKADADADADQANGRVITLLPRGKSRSPNVTYKLILAYTLAGRAFQILPPFGPKFKAVPEDRAALVRFFALLPGVVDEGWLRPLPVQVVDGGWDGIANGLDMLRRGKVRGTKLVVELES